MAKILNEKRSKIVVIIGGGFAGANLAMHLLKNKSYRIILIDKNNYNYFPPLLYQVATSFLDPSSISYPFRKMFRNERISFRMSEVLKIDPENKLCYLSNGELSYDHLIFACGAKTNFFGNERIKQQAIPMKTIDDALRMRNALLQTLELASITQDLQERKKLLTIVVAGGGPTGVEVSGMLAEMKKHILAKDYPELKETPGAIYIVNGGDTLLSPMSEKTHKAAYKALNNLGVNIKLNNHVNDFGDDRVILSNGEIIEARTLIWAAGITANTFEGIPPTSLGVGKRMITDQYHKVKGLTDIWSIGDCSIQFEDSSYPTGHPQLAQVAIQQGLHLARNFSAMANGKPLSAFKYFDKGEMAIVGRQYAMVDLFKHKVHVKGIPALLIWLFVHLLSLVKYTNKVKTFFSWVTAYLTKDQSLRMIFRS